MTGELTPRNDPQETDREASPDVLERLVKQGDNAKQGEMEVVTTSSGTILYIPQSLDE